MDLEDGKEYRITWKDSQNYAGWQSFIKTHQIANSDERLNITTGVFVASKSDNEYVTLAHTYDTAHRNHLNLLKILRVSIHDISEISHQPFLPKITKHFSLRKISSPFSIAVFILSLGILILALYHVHSFNHAIVKGKYGTKCYLAGQESNNIKYPVYFDSLDECMKSLQ